MFQDIAKLKLKQPNGLLENLKSGKLVMLDIIILMVQLWVGQTNFQIVYLL